MCVYLSHVNINKDRGYQICSEGYECDGGKKRREKICNSISIENILSKKDAKTYIIINWKNKKEMDKFLDA